jgi:hypothetical protein
MQSTLITKVLYVDIINQSISGVCQKTANKVYSENAIDKQYNYFPDHFLITSLLLFTIVTAKVVVHGIATHFHI